MKEVQICGYSAMQQDGEIWICQRSISRILGISPQAVSMHVRDIKLAGYEIGVRKFSVSQCEGQRTVTRNQVHYSSDVLLLVALKSRNAPSDLADALHKVGIRKNAQFITRKERAFGELLAVALEGIVTVRSQVPVGRYRIDFYIPEINVAIEYDEQHHAHSRQSALDRKRQYEIEKLLGSTFIRVIAGKEVQGLNAVLRRLNS